MDKVLGSRHGQKQQHQQSIMGKTLFHCTEKTMLQTALQLPPNAQDYYFTTELVPTAEQTLQHYKGPKDHLTQTPYNPENLPTRTGPTGLQHP